MPYNLHGETERAREALWAAKEDSKALDALRNKLRAEAEMTENVAQLRSQAQGN